MVLLFLLLLFILLLFFPSPSFMFLYTYTDTNTLQDSFLTIFDIFWQTDRPRKGDIEAPTPELKIVSIRTRVLTTRHRIGGTFTSVTESGLHPIKNRNVKRDAVVKLGQAQLNQKD